MEVSKEEARIINKIRRLRRFAKERKVAQIFSLTIMPVGNKLKGHVKCSDEEEMEFET